LRTSATCWKRRRDDSVGEASFAKSGGAPQEFSGPLAVNAQRVYSVSATAVVDIQSVQTTLTSVIGPFGLEMTDPASSSDAAPVYDVSAAISIMVTDTMSGAEYAPSYSFTGFLARHATYRVKAFEGAGGSAS